MINRFNPLTSRNHPRAKSVSKEDRQGLNAIFFCSDTTDSPIIDHHIKKTLTSLTTLKTIEKKVTNPYLFRVAPMVTTFVRPISNRTKMLWHFIEEASWADIRLAKMEHPSLKKMMIHCAGRVMIYVHPCFYRSLKLKYPLDIGGIFQRRPSYL